MKKWKSSANTLLFNIGAVAVGLLISLLLLAFMKVNPFEIISLTLGKIFGDRYNMGEVLVKSTPLIFTSLAFAFTYKANLFNIGAQGQFYMGCIVAVSLSLALGDVLPTVVLILLVLVASFAAGGATGCFIGFVKAKFGANEFLVSMMSTYVISAFMDYLLRTSLQETKAKYLQTDPISKSAYLPNLIDGTRVHWGFVIAVAAAVAVWILLNKTALGAVLGTLAFGLADSISIYIQAIGLGGNFPREFIIALPYILTIVLTIFRKNFNVPAKLGIHTARKIE